MSNETMLIGNILGSILQPLYTCLFIIFAKQLKGKNIYFIGLTIIDYIVIQNTLTFKTGINADLLFVIIMLLNLKLIYSKESRITDVITYILSEIILGLISIVAYFIFGMNEIALIFALLAPIMFVLVASKKLIIIEKFYNKFWNRKKEKTKIKSITVRGISIGLTIFVSLILHFWIIYLLIR